MPTGFFVSEAEGRINKMQVDPGMGSAATAALSSEELRALTKQIPGLHLRPMEQSALFGHGVDDSALAKLAPHSRLRSGEAERLRGQLEARRAEVAAAEARRKAQELRHLASAGDARKTEAALQATIRELTRQNQAFAESEAALTHRLVGLAAMLQASASDAGSEWRALRGQLVDLSVRTRHVLRDMRGFCDLNDLGRPELFQLNSEISQLASGLDTDDAAEQRASTGPGNEDDPTWATRALAQLEVPGTNSQHAAFVRRVVAGWRRSRQDLRGVKAEQAQVSLCVGAIERQLAQFAGLSPDEGRDNKEQGGGRGGGGGGGGGVMMTPRGARALRRRMGRATDAPAEDEEVARLRQTVEKLTRQASEDAATIAALRAERRSGTMTGDEERPSSFDARRIAHLVSANKDLLEQKEEDAATIKILRRRQGDEGTG